MSNSETKVQFIFDFDKVNKVKYKNYKGEIRDRYITPQLIWYGTTEYHPEPQLFLLALDVEKGTTRDFALNDFIF